jgi:hypothetical protein
MVGEAVVLKNMKLIRDKKVGLLLRTKFWRRFIHIYLFVYLFIIYLTTAQVAQFM